MIYLKNKKGEISYRDYIKQFIQHGVNMFISAVKLGILTWGSIGIDSPFEPASSGHSKNCIFCHFCNGCLDEMTIVISDCQIVPAIAS